MSTTVKETDTLVDIPGYVPQYTLIRTIDTGNTYIGTGESSPNPSVQLFADPNGSTPGGFGGDVQFNNGSGGFAGSAATIDASGNLTLPATLVDGLGSAGTSGYVLSSTGTGVRWVAGGGGGSTAWSSLTNPNAALTLSMGGNPTTFNHTSAVAWIWANTTPAVNGTDQSSPSFTLSGQFWNSTATGFDQWKIQNVVTGNGPAARGTLQLIHSSTGDVSAGDILINDAAGPVAITIQNNGVDVFSIAPSGSANTPSTVTGLNRPLALNGTVPPTAVSTNGGGVTLGALTNPITFAPSSGAVNGIAAGVYSQCSQTGSATGNFTGTLFQALGNAAGFLGTTFLTADFQNDNGSVFQIGTTGAVCPSGSTLTDNNGSTGTANQVLTAGAGGGVVWGRGSLLLTVTTKSASYTPSAADQVVLFTATATATLDSTLAAGTNFTLKNTSAAGTLTVTPSSGKLDNQTSWALSTMQSIEVVFDGVNWWTI